MRASEILFYWCSFCRLSLLNQKCKGISRRSKFIERKIEREVGYKSIRADMLGSGGETVLKENWGQWEDRVYL